MRYSAPRVVKTYVQTWSELNLGQPVLDGVAEVLKIDKGEFPVESLGDILQRSEERRR